MRKLSAPQKIGLALAGAGAIGLLFLILRDKLRSDEDGIRVKSGFDRAKEPSEVVLTTISGAGFDQFPDPDDPPSAEKRYKTKKNARRCFDVKVKAGTCVAGASATAVATIRLTVVEGLTTYGVDLKSRGNKLIVWGGKWTPDGVTLTHRGTLSKVEAFALDGELKLSCDATGNDMEAEILVCKP